MISDFNVLLTRVEGFADTDVDERTDSPLENLARLRLVVIFFAGRMTLISRLFWIFTIYYSLTGNVLSV